ncbi:MAG: hypothetical protein CVU20_08510 [Betaproteobacteria bacterium HGW-Betaproteobacteria-14]|nr:MAG: hypothetical protein CVU20_08510 [Betaproteobacteria bacterium HGW-Betaproteobacteria-14]
MARSLRGDYRQLLTSGGEAAILVWSFFAPQIFIAAASAVTAAGLAFFAWVDCHRRGRAVADTPTSLIASAAQGYVELAGRSRPLPGRPLAAPLSGEPCVWHRHRVERYEGDDWSIEEEGESEAPFMLEDASGACLVLPQGTEMTGLKAATWYNDEIGDARSWRVIDRGDRKKTEWLLVEDEEVHALGEFATLRGKPLEEFLRGEIAQRIAGWKAAPAALVARFDLDADGAVDGREWELARSQARRETLRDFGSPDELHLLRQPDDRRPFLIRRGVDGEAIGQASYRRWAFFHVAVFLLALATLPHALGKPW